MNELMVSFQQRAGSADDDINLFLVCSKNSSWQLHEVHDGRFAGLGSKIGQLSLRAFGWCNKNIVVSMENYTLLISKVQNGARSYRFWLCPVYFVLWIWRELFF